MLQLQFSRPLQYSIKKVDYRWSDVEYGQWIYGHRFATTHSLLQQLKCETRLIKLNENLLGIAIPESFISLWIALIFSHSWNGVLFYFYFFAFYCFGGGTVSKDSTALLYCNG